MLLETLEDSLSDDEAGTVMLRANARVGIAASAGGSMGTIAAMLPQAIPLASKMVGIIVAFALLLMLVSLFTFVARRAPAALTKNFAAQVATRRRAGQQIKIFSGRGATALGLFTFVLGFALGVGMLG